MQLCKHFGPSTGPNEVVNVRFTLTTRPSVVAYCLHHDARRGCLQLATRVVIDIVRYRHIDTVRTALLSHPVFVADKLLSDRVGADCLPQWFMLYKRTRSL